MSQTARQTQILALAAAAFGIMTFSGMDAAMKGLATDVGAYNAMLWRAAAGTVIGIVPYLVDRGWTLPGPGAMRLHLLRGAISAVMATSFFYGIVRIPLAEGIALSFIAPLIALYLAAVILHERIGRESIVGSVVALIGVAVLLAARLWPDHPAAGVVRRDLDGVGAILLSAILYAWNLILMRQQSQVARPAEVALMQNITCGGFLLLAAPWLSAAPEMRHFPAVLLSAGLAFVSLFIISWAYGKAEARILIPVEYTAFVWAAIMGAIFFAEALTWSTLIGAILIIAGCLIAAFAGNRNQTSLEPNF